jgi:hypothetical protein
MGGPAGEEDRWDMLPNEIPASAAPKTGWRHFRYCECRRCEPHRYRGPGMAAKVVDAAVEGVIDNLWRIGT